MKRMKNAFSRHPYFKAILYILDAAKLIHISGNIDDSLFLVVLGPFYR